MAWTVAGLRQRRRGAQSTARQYLGAQPIAELRGAQLRIENVPVESKPPGEITASGIGIESPQVVDHRPHVLKGARKTLRDQALHPRRNDRSRRRQRVL